jgi:hypothetical protein
VIYLTLPELLHVAERVLGPGYAVRDYGLLEAALARPQATAFGKDAYPDLDAKAAAASPIRRTRRGRQGTMRSRGQSSQRSTALHTDVPPRMGWGHDPLADIGAGQPVPHASRETGVRAVRWRR